MTDIDTPPRIILLGATGYTGDLTARSLIAQGARTRSRLRATF